MIKLIKRFPLFFQLFRFGVVGISAASIHFVIVILLVQFKLLTPLTANIIGFLISFQASYWGHRIWTFNDSMVLHRIALPKLFALQVLNFTMNETLFFVFLKENLPYPIALFLVLAILPIFTFTISKLWIFE